MHERWRADGDNGMREGGVKDADRNAGGTLKKERISG